MVDAFQFVADSEAPSKLLREIAMHMTPMDFELLRSEVVFEYAHVAAVESMLRPLETFQLPKTDLASYKNAISELVHLRDQTGYSVWMRSYLATLYIYGEAMEHTIADESDYYRMLVEFVLVDKLTSLGNYFLAFIEWLFDNTDWQFRNQDYWLLLSWLIMRGELGGAPANKYANVFILLSQRKYSPDEISRLTVCEYDSKEWRRLQMKMKLPSGYSQQDFDEIIVGHSSF